MQGSDYPNGRDRFSVPMDVDGARYAGISHLSSSSGCTPEFSFDNVTLEDLKDLTAPSNVNCNQFQQPSNSNEPGSSDRKHSSSNECGERSVLGKFCIRVGQFLSVGLSYILLSVFFFDIACRVFYTKEWLLGCGCV